MKPRWAAAAAAAGLVAGVAACGTVPAPADDAALLARRRDAGLPDCGQPQASGTAAPDGLRAAQLPCLGGGGRFDPARPGTPTVYVLFAQWCGPCRAEMPVLAEALREQPGLNVVLVNSGETNPALAVDLLRETGVRHQVVSDPDWAFSDAVGLPHSLPRTLLVDASTRVVLRKEGGWKSAAELREALATKLEVRP